MSLGTIIADFLLIPINIGISQDLARLHTPLQWHAHLPKPEIGSHVYLVCRPPWGFPTSKKHWSLYTQGHFYHLTVDQPRSFLVQSVELAKTKRKAVSRPVLNDEDLSDETTDRYQFYSQHKDKLALIAYEVGRTDYNSSDVLRIAQWITSHMQVYSRIKSNCQIFAGSLMYRLIMTKRDLSMFVGNGVQLVNWDRRRHDVSNETLNTYQNCPENGFEIKHVSLVRKSGGFSNPLLADLAAFVGRIRITSLGVRTLHTHGSRAPGAYASCTH